MSHSSFSSRTMSPGPSIGHDDDYLDKCSLLNNDKDVWDSLRSTPQQARRTPSQLRDSISSRCNVKAFLSNPVALCTLLIISILTNICLFAITRQNIKDMMPDTLTATASLGQKQGYRSKYAELAADLHTLVEEPSEYSSANMTLAGPLWDSLNFDHGMVALSYEYTDSIGLPRAQKFPWDHEKGLYVLNGYHNLHCLKSIHLSIREYIEDKPQTRSLHHITHCLDSLRQDVLCNADDTPRYTTVTKDTRSAVGQLRQCKDWTKLDEWAKEHSACYRYLGAEADYINQFERFKYCPPDSPYWEQVRKHFRKPDGWFPKPGELAGTSKVHKLESE